MLKDYLLKVQKRLLECNRCNYVWMQKNLNRKPKNCPRCNSPYYDKPRQKEIKLMLTKHLKF
jgi:predicted Zn-ribbon and HTH transcriptional regulator